MSDFDRRTLQVFGALVYRAVEGLNELLRFAGAVLSAARVFREVKRKRPPQKAAATKLIKDADGFWL